MFRVVSRGRGESAVIARAVMRFVIIQRSDRVAPLDGGEVGIARACVGVWERFVVRMTGFASARRVLSRCRVESAAIARAMLRCVITQKIAEHDPLGGEWFWCLGFVRSWGGFAEGGRLAVA